MIFSKQVDEEIFVQASAEPNSVRAMPSAAENHEVNK